MSKVPIIDLDALMGKELNSVVCAAYKMGCDQTREVYQKRIEKLEAALRGVIAVADRDAPQFRFARAVLEGKDE